MFSFSALGVLTSVSGTWVGVVGNGSGNFAMANVTASTATYSGGNITSITVTAGSKYWFILQRVS
jgi:hypothetical protein